jgi:hypothetical protein
MARKPTTADAHLILELYDLRREAEMRKAVPGGPENSSHKMPTTSSKLPGRWERRKMPGCAR